jgi:hypothetical protein
MLGALRIADFLCRETGMSIAISSDELEQLRVRLRKMPDGELIRFGKAASLCRNRDCPDTFKRQLEVK